MHSLPQLTRRRMLQLASPLAAGLALTGLPTTTGRAKDAPPALARTPDEALKVLVEGNLRFQKGEAHEPRRKPADFQRLAEGQNPLAIVIGCADSRVTPELVFDQGIGDLFVVRLAGNVINGAGAVVNGSIEYGVVELNVSLVVVLGHSQCGALKAAMKHIDANDPLPGALDDLVHLIKPAVARVKDKPGNRLENAIKANVETGVTRLKNLKPVLADRVKEGKLRVIGGVYDLKTGHVNFLE